MKIEIIALIICLVLGVIFLIFHFCWKQKRNQTLAIQQEEKNWILLKNNIFLMLAIFLVFSGIILAITAIS